MNKLAVVYRLSVGKWKCVSVICQEEKREPPLTIAPPVFPFQRYLSCWTKNSSWCIAGIFWSSTNPNAKMRHRHFVT